MVSKATRRTSQYVDSFDSLFGSLKNIVVFGVCAVLFWYGAEMLLGEQLPSPLSILPDEMIVWLRSLVRFH